MVNKKLENLTLYEKNMDKITHVFMYYATADELESLKEGLGNKTYIFTTSEEDLNLKKFLWNFILDVLKDDRVKNVH